jgi:diguanylate cyclase
MSHALRQRQQPSDVALFDRIGAMLDANGLDPSPAHYELIHSYFTLGDDRLVAAIDDAIRQYGALTPEMAAAIAARRRSDISPAALDRMADEAQRHLIAISTIADRSGREAVDYGDALARSVTDLAAGSESAPLAALLDLTRTMIARTRGAGEELRRSAAEVEALRANLTEARRIADTDALTGLPNRRALDCKMRIAFDAARQRGDPLSVAICDIDGFKAVNDEHGHQLGDEVIRFIGAALSRAAADNMYVARYGGEEFVVMFEGTAPPEAAAHIDGVRADIAARDFKVAETGRPIGRLTFSAGIAAMEGRKGPAATLKSADSALYRAKRGGRNQVRIAE